LGRRHSRALLGVSFLTIGDAFDSPFKVLQTA
jgi:hypothetical protein